MKLAFLYAGQGSQKVGMGKDLYEENDIFKRVLDDINLDFDVKELMFNGPMEKLSQTKYTQPCMAAFAAGVTCALKSKGIKPEYVAGLSLGEYSALHCAQVLNTKEFVELVAFRGKVMDEAAAGIQCKMSAVMGMESDVLENICKEVTEGYVTVSNYNCKGQYVICGEEVAVNRAEEKAKEQGAKRCIPLKVSGPFHTRYMKPAGDKLREYFKNVSFGEMTIPVIFNTTAKPLAEGECIQEILETQVQSGIHMESIIRYLENEGVDTVIEIGPGKVLSGFVKKTAPSIKVYSIEDAKDLAQVIESFTTME